MELVNETPFRAERVALLDVNGRDLLVVIVKGTFRLNGPHAPLVADIQVPIQIADVFNGEPGKSSVHYESDLCPRKPGTDIVLIGHAYPPRGRMPLVDVNLAVGPIRKSCRVFGDRTWKKDLMSRIGISAPQPFERMPLVYERAFGGQDQSAPNGEHHEQETRNPVGTGLVAKKSAADLSTVALPNIEDPARLISSRDDRPSPAGFGFIGRHWQPRLAYAGTYDEAWLKNRSPQLPVDFNERYHNGAHPDLVFQGRFTGGERVELQNGSPEGRLGFPLPRAALEIIVVTSTLERTVLQPVVDTLVLEPDEKRMTMVWRAMQDVHGTLLKIGMIRVRASA